MARASKVASTFDSHDFGFKWSYAEMISGGPHGYGLSWASDDSRRLPVRHARHDRPRPKTRRPTCSRTQLLRKRPRRPKSSKETPGTCPLDDASVDCIVFDPPYEENVCYAELSDFFYVWLKRTAGLRVSRRLHRLLDGKRPGGHLQPSPVQNHVRPKARRPRRWP